MTTSPEPKLAIDEYDRVHGDPAQTPAAPKISESDAWGTNLIPVDSGAVPAKDLKAVGG